MQAQQMTTQQRRAVIFWKEVRSTFPHPQIDEWISLLETGNVDYFRNGGLVRIAVANKCYIGRIGFDQNKYDHAIAQFDRLSRELGISPLQD